ncbi:MAG: hypothetical protein JST89_11855 [Cyanobacteria bacterium SZAS-4]|nr:hypothetical protein [Cyanobacteria bacterium SZAS-4]
MTQPDESEEEKQARIEAKIAQMIKNGYKRSDLIITEAGRVMFDPTAAEAEALKAFDKKEKKSS